MKISPVVKMPEQELPDFDEDIPVFVFKEKKPEPDIIIITPAKHTKRKNSNALF